MAGQIASIDWIGRAAHLEARHGERRQQALHTLRAILDALGVRALLEGIGQQVWRDGAVRFASRDHGHMGECGYELACAYDDVVTFVDAIDDYGHAEPGGAPACEAGACESVLAVTISWRSDEIGRIVGREIGVRDTIGRPVGTNRRGAMGRRVPGTDVTPVTHVEDSRAWPPIPLSEGEAEIGWLLETHLAASCAVRLANDLSIPELRRSGRARVDALGLRVYAGRP